MKKEKQELNLEQELAVCDAEARRLDAVSDQFAKLIERLDEKLNTIRPGVSAWHVAAAGSKPRSLGYTKINGQWGLAARISDPPNVQGKTYEEEVWRFNEAPRWLRLELISALPTFLQVLQLRIAQMKEQMQNAVNRLDAVLADLDRSDTDKMSRWDRLSDGLIWLYNRKSRD